MVSARSVLHALRVQSRAKNTEFQNWLSLRHFFDDSRQLREATDLAEEFVALIRRVGSIGRRGVRVVAHASVRAATLEREASFTLLLLSFLTRMVV